MKVLVALFILISCFCSMVAAQPTDEECLITLRVATQPQLAIEGPTTDHVRTVLGDHGGLRYILRLKPGHKEWASLPTLEFPDFTGHLPGIIAFWGEDLARFLGFEYFKNTGEMSIPNIEEYNGALNKISQQKITLNGRQLRTPVVRYYPIGTEGNVHVEGSEFINGAMKKMFPFTTLHDASVHNPSAAIPKRLMEYNARISEVLNRFVKFARQELSRRNDMVYLRALIQFREIMYDNGNATFATFLPPFADLVSGHWNKLAAQQKAVENGWALHFFGLPPTEVVKKMLMLTSLEEFQHTLEGVAPNQRPFEEGTFEAIAGMFKLRSQYFQSQIGFNSVVQGPLSPQAKRSLERVFAAYGKFLATQNVPRGLNEGMFFSPESFVDTMNQVRLDYAAAILKDVEQ